MDFSVIGAFIFDNPPAVGVVIGVLTVFWVVLKNASSMSEAQIKELVNSLARDSADPKPKPKKKKKKPMPYPAEEIYGGGELVDEENWLYAQEPPPVPPSAASAPSYTRLTF